MSLERAEERMRLAEHQVAILAKGKGERLFEIVLMIFAGWSMLFLLAKILLIALGVVHTIASPLTIVFSMLFLIMGTSFVLIRMIARKIADHELQQSKLYLSQFRYMSPLITGASRSTGGGGLSNYKKINLNVTGKQFAAQVKAATNATNNASKTTLRTGKR